MSVADLGRVVAPPHPRKTVAQGNFSLSVLEHPAEPMALLLGRDHGRLRVVVETAPVGAAEPVREGDQPVTLVEDADHRTAVARQRTEQPRVQPVLRVLVAEDPAIQRRGLGEPGRRGERDRPVAVLSHTIHILSKSRR
jgi:hypothetical protein